MLLCCSFGFIASRRADLSTAALATRFDVAVTSMCALLKGAIIEQWGRMRAVDSDEGRIDDVEGVLWPNGGRQSEVGAVVGAAEIKTPR